MVKKEVLDLQKDLNLVGTFKNLFLSRADARLNGSLF
jgi:hypothetical protein